MSKTRDQLDSFEVALNDEIKEGCKLYPAWDNANGIFERAAYTAFNEDFCLDDLLDAWKEKLTRKVMRIQRVRFSKLGGNFPSSWNGKNGYELRLELNDGSIGMCLRVPCETVNGIEYVPSDLIEKVLECACLDYWLVEWSRWERETIGNKEAQQ